MTDCRRICRQAFNDLGDLLWDEVLMKQDFTSLGSVQFKQDIIAFETMACAYFSSSHIIVMQRLKEAVELLSLPVNKQDGDFCLKEAVTAVYGTPDQLADLLESQCLSSITGLDAKLILSRRREATE